MGPPPPGTLLGVMAATVGVLGEEFPAKAAVATRARAEMRIMSFISRSPSDFAFTFRVIALS
jgi:hypothetical protein